MLQQQAHVHKVLHEIHTELDMNPEARRAVVLRGLVMAVGRSLLLSMVITPTFTFWMLLAWSDGSVVVMVDPWLRALALMLFVCIAAIALVAGPRPRQFLDAEVRRRLLMRLEH